MFDFCSLPTNVPLVSFVFKINLENRVFLYLHQSIHLPFSVYQSQISVLMGLHCILSPLPPLFITLLHAHAHSPLRGPLNQALHMSDPHLLLSPPLLSTTPSPLPIPCSHSGFCSVAAAAAAAPLPSATTQQRGKEWAKDGWKNKEGNKEDMEDTKNGTTAKVREKIRERESAYS